MNNRSDRLLRGELAPDVKRQQDEERAEELDMQRRVRTVMGTQEGRQFVLDFVFVRCGVLNSSFVQKDSMASAFNEGRRNVGLEMLAEVEKHAPDLHLLARREELERRQKKVNSVNKTQETSNG